MMLPSVREYIQPLAAHLEQRLGSVQKEITREECLERAGALVMFANLTPQQLMTIVDLLLGCQAAPKGNIAVHERVDSWRPPLSG